jgi:hypothetical protein
MVCVAFATARQVTIATTVATSMADQREDFSVRTIMVFILYDGFVVVFSSADSSNWFLSVTPGVDPARSYIGLVRRPIRALSRGFPGENVAVQKRQPDCSGQRKQG